MAWSQVQNKLQLAMASLPEVVQSQGVKVSKSTRNYLILVGLVSTDGNMNNDDLNDYAQSNIEKVLSRVPGVGEVETFGSQICHARVAQPRQTDSVQPDCRRRGHGVARLQRRGFGRPVRRRTGVGGPAAQCLDPRAKPVDHTRTNSPKSPCGPTPTGRCCESRT
jgi:hypothetical protein